MARVLTVEDDPASMDLALHIVRLDLHIAKLGGWGFVKRSHEEAWAIRAMLDKHVAPARVTR